MASTDPFNGDVRNADEDFKFIQGELQKRKNADSAGQSTAQVSRDSKSSSIRC
jgi:hypothetical protein